VVRALIRETAIVFDWDPTVQWDGPHTMRNGASQEAEACMKAPVASVLKRAVWSTVCTAARYQKLRGKKARKGVRTMK